MDFVLLDSSSGEGREGKGVTGVFLMDRKEMYSSSRPGDRNRIARPRRPARAARPQRWRKTFGSVGGSSCRTRSTSGMSSPRAARSVVRRMVGAVEVRKAVKFRFRCGGDWWPWRGSRVYSLGIKRGKRVMCRSTLAQVWR